MMRFTRGDVASRMLILASPNRMPSFASAERYAAFRDALVGAWWEVIVGRLYLDEGRISRSKIRRALQERVGGG